MVRRKLEKRRFCRKLRESGFFEDVNFKNKILQKSVEAWFWEVTQKRGQNVTKFKELLDNLYNLEFPVKIYGEQDFNNIELCILDSNEQIYQMTLFKSNFEIYCIGQSFCYNCKSNSKFYKETILETGSNGPKYVLAFVSSTDSEDEDPIEISYHNEIANIEFTTNGRTIMISYPINEIEINENYLSAYLIESLNGDYNNVSTILKRNIGNVQSAKNIFIIGSKKNLVNSILRIQNGKVVNYSYTEIEEKNRVSNTRIELNSSIEEFLAKY